jgi:hypothetical protein
LDIELDDLDHRVVGEAVVEHVGRLVEIVGDTTRTISARQAALRELRVLVSLLPWLQRMTITSELGWQSGLQGFTKRSRALSQLRKPDSLGLYKD